jgi:hypothetical protein
VCEMNVEVVKKLQEESRREDGINTKIPGM